MGKRKNTLKKNIFFLEVWHVQGHFIPKNNCKIIHIHNTQNVFFQALQNGIHLNDF